MLHPRHEYFVITGVKFDIGSLRLMLRKVIVSLTSAQFSPKYLVVHIG